MISCCSCEFLRSNVCQTTPFKGRAGDPLFLRSEGAGVGASASRYASASDSSLFCCMRGPKIGDGGVGVTGICGTSCEVLLFMLMHPSFSLILLLVSGVSMDCS